MVKDDAQIIPLDPRNVEILESNTSVGYHR